MCAARHNKTRFVLSLSLSLCAVCAQCYLNFISPYSMERMSINKTNKYASRTCTVQRVHIYRLSSPHENAVQWKRPRASKSLVYANETLVHSTESTWNSCAHQAQRTAHECLQPSVMCFSHLFYLTRFGRQINFRCFHNSSSASSSLAAAAIPFSLHHNYFLSLRCAPIKFQTSLFEFFYFIQRSASLWILDVQSQTRARARV